MLLLGIDIGTSSVKVSVVDANTQQCIASVFFPEQETVITTLKQGWAEQSPEMWWEHVQAAIHKLHSQKLYNPSDVKAIGISYQMHGLVIVDDKQKVLRDSIIWCDSRAIPYGNNAFEKIGEEKCLSHLLNSPGNFTAAKLAWVKENEPHIYAKADKVMLPGDFIAMKLTGEITTSIAALSEGVFWDFQSNELSKDIFNHFGVSTSLIPEIRNVFSEHGRITNVVAKLLNLLPGTPVTYKSGDQPNNALSLNVLEPGEVAATAGTSGVIYGVTEKLSYDRQSRVNSFAHVNHTAENRRIGILLCINGTGIFNNWIRSVAGNGHDYVQMNANAAKIVAGSNGLLTYPFGNGAERMLNNRSVHAHLHNINLNIHTKAHLYRSAQEGIAFSFRYGMDILRENGVDPRIIRAGKTNMFLSPVFTQCFVDILNTSVELYNSDGSSGAALGAGIGAGIYKSPGEAFQEFYPIETVEPKEHNIYNELYGVWKEHLINLLN